MDDGAWPVEVIMDPFAELTLLGRADEATGDWFTVVVDPAEMLVKAEVMGFDVCGVDGTGVTVAAVTKNP